MHRHITGIATVLALGSLAACGGVDVEPTPQPAPPDDAPMEAHVALSPQSGEPGTTVTLEGHGLTPGAVVTIGFGPPQSEYEVLEEVTADADGSVRTTVQVPDWAERDREYVFVADGPDELAIAEFRVTVGDDTPGHIRVSGVLIDDGGA